MQLFSHLRLEDGILELKEMSRSHVRAVPGSSTVVDYRFSNIPTRFCPRGAFHKGDWRPWRTLWGSLECYFFNDVKWMSRKSFNLKAVIQFDTVSWWGIWSRCRWWFSLSTGALWHGLPGRWRITLIKNAADVNMNNVPMPLRETSFC